MEPLKRENTATGTSSKSFYEALKGCVLRAASAHSAAGPDFLCLAHDVTEMDNLIN